MEMFTQDALLLTPERMAEIERHLADEWSWGLIAKLLSRKWGESFSAAELQAQYKRTKKQLDDEEMARKRQKLAYYSAYWE